MSDAVIKVENLAKRYLVGHRSAQGERYTTLRDVIVREARNFTRRAIDGLRGRQIVQGDEVEEFWALKDVSFEVRPGEVIGIIGRNGAGKSTLLKILSRITEPTVGRVRLRGRVASLLEVGTGFHPELTGRENIFLNGCILGMKRQEIRRKFDEIVAFAEVEKFLDTPVKHYSSGMYVRLAFAVAAHLEPEILVIDEVLAVGDATFQQKALAKLDGVVGSGRTVLFVSHNMTAVQSLCSRVIHIESGQVKSQGDPITEVRNYLSSARLQRETNRSARVGESLVISEVTFSPNPVESRSDIQFSLTFTANSPVRINSGELILYALTGPRVGVIDLRSTGLPSAIETGERLEIRGLIRSLPLVEGRYKWNLWLDLGIFAGEIPNLVELIVFPTTTNHPYAPAPPEYRGWLEFDTEMSAQRSNRSHLDCTLS